MAKVIMIQGTMSNAGKSLLVAGLCRIFRQDGYRVAPFKSQNMALNSFITEEGLEMGRAQVVQAEAAGVKPVAAMNPILLKPTNDVGSQVIVNGIPIGNLSAREYFAYKKQLIPEIKKAFDTLKEQYDIIVIEGAGSPAEINLKSDDIVNMGMAKMADAPVLLVGDIDRGGVFAQLYGTIMLLEPEEQARIKGMIINKFRGDKTILDSGVTMIENLCQKPVVGVTPYMNIDIEEEDSLSNRLEPTMKQALIDMAVIRFPRISNYTDFSIFTCMPGVSLRFVTTVEELSDTDMVILPGTKNTIGDLLWMRQNGLEAVILKLSGRGIPVFGICGGFQMLGASLQDIYGVENGGTYESIQGIGLLPVETIFEEEKTRTRVSGTFGTVGGIFHKLSGIKLEGYEIHMGKTHLLESLPGLTCLKEYQHNVNDEKLDGCYRNNIYGTYVHGIFDEAGIAQTIIHALLEKKGICASEAEVLDYAAYKETQYDKLAEQLRVHLDMEQIYKILS